MALSSSSLALRIKDRLKLRSWIHEGVELDQLCEDLAAAVVAEIQANATATVTVNPLGLTAPPGGGPVVGTATGTGGVS